MLNCIKKSKCLGLKDGSFGFFSQMLSPEEKNLENIEEEEGKSDCRRN